MEFTISCPMDGTIDVSLEDVDTVVLRDEEHADITFVCPTCGTEIKVAAVVPSFLMSAIKALADSEDDVSKGAFAGMFDSRNADECAIVAVSRRSRCGSLLRVLQASAGRGLWRRRHPRGDRLLSLKVIGAALLP